MKIPKSILTFFKKPANDFALMTVMAALPCILLAPDSKWVAIAALSYAILMGRLYGKVRWLDGFAEGSKGVGAEKTHSEDCADQLLKRAEK